MSYSHVILAWRRAPRTAPTIFLPTRAASSARARAEQATDHLTAAGIELSPPAAGPLAEPLAGHPTRPLAERAGR